MRLFLHVRRHLGALAAATLLGSSGMAAVVAVTAAPAAATTVSNEVQFRDAWANDSEIVLADDIVLTCDGGGRAERSATTDFTLDGQGHTISQTCPGNGVLKAGPFESELPNGVVRNVTITGGTENEPGEHGGGLYFDSAGTLLVDHAAILDNTTCADGGGLDYEGHDLTITHSTIAGNTAAGYGGALWAGGSTDVVTDSTISGNQASNASAFETGGSDVTLAYVTMVQNDLGQLSGCEASDGAVSEGHGGPSATVDVAAQLDIDNGTLVSFGSVVALPGGGGTNCYLVTPPSDSQGYNFSDDDSCGFTATGDHENAGDPMLGALGANGGLAPTQVPQSGSPLIDAIPVTACQTGVASGVTDDERGVTRPQGPGCDVGAVEVEVEPPPPPSPPPPTPAPLVVTPRFTG